MIIQDGKREEEFIEELMEHGGPQLRDFIMTCYQCGACGGGCPTSCEMDYTPRRIVRMIQFGMRREVLSSLTPWLCTSCYSCITSCPRKVEITRLMYALRNMTIKEGAATKAEPSPKFYLSFLSVLRRHGRMNEVELLEEYKSREGLVMMALQEGLHGLRLLVKGKMRLRREGIQQVAHMSTILKPIEEE